MCFQRRFRLKFFLPYGLILTKMNKNHKKNKKNNFKNQNQKKISGNMVNLELVPLVVSKKMILWTDRRLHNTISAVLQ